MATIGTALTAPETGWQRIDNADSRIAFGGGVVAYATGVTGVYNGTTMYSNSPYSKIKFKFYGTKLRIMGYMTANRSSNIQVRIDDTTETFSEYRTPDLAQALVYEKTGLDLKVHTVEITCPNAMPGGTLVYYDLDSIDIDDTGYMINLLSTNSDLKTLQIGDRIPCKYVANSGAIGTFSEFGTSVATEIPYASSATPNGLFYWIFVGYDSKGRMKFLADRNLQHSITWDTLNDAGLCSRNGLPVNLGLPANYATSMRLLGGGKDKEDSGQSEWNEIVVNSTLGGRVPSSSDNVWHYTVGSWASSIPRLSCYNVSGSVQAAATDRVLRGYVDSYGAAERWNFTSSNSVNVAYGFRPLLIIEELDSFPTINLDEPFGLFSKIETLFISGSISDLDSGNTVQYKIENTSQNLLMKDYQSLAASPTAIADNFSIDSRFQNYMDNSIVITARDNYLGTTTKVFYVFPVSDKYFVYSKYAEMKNIQLPAEVSQLMVSAQYTGRLLCAISTDNGATWKSTDLEEILNVGAAQQLKVRFFGDLASIIKAYGLGW